MSGVLPGIRWGEDARGEVDNRGQVKASQVLVSGSRDFFGTFQYMSHEPELTMLSLVCLRLWTLPTASMPALYAFAFGRGHDAMGR